MRESPWIRSCFQEKLLGQRRLQTGLQLPKKYGILWSKNPSKSRYSGSAFHLLTVSCLTGANARTIMAWAQGQTSSNAGGSGMLTASSGSKIFYAKSDNAPQWVLGSCVTNLSVQPLRLSASKSRWSPQQKRWKRPSRSQNSWPPAAWLDNSSGGARVPVWSYQTTFRFL